MEEETGTPIKAVGQGRPTAVYRLAAGDEAMQYQMMVLGCEMAGEAVVA